MLAVVTGASAGIGLETAKALASNTDYSRVVLACRNRSKTEAAISVWDEKTREKCQIFSLDLASLDSVEIFAAMLVSERTTIDRLVLNAGINNYTCDAKKLTVDGFDEIWQVNFLAHFYLCSLLPGVVRVVALSSCMHWFGSVENFSHLHTSHNVSPTSVYSDSKLAMAVFAHALSGKVEAVAVNPGAVASDIFKSFFQGGKLHQLLRRMFNAPLLSCSNGAKTSVYACTMEYGKFVYLSPYGQIKGKGRWAACLSDIYWFYPASKESRFVGECDSAVSDPLVGKQLWELASKALGTRMANSEFALHST